MLAALEDAEIELVLCENAAMMAECYPEYSAAMLRDEVAVTRGLGFAVNEGHVVKGSWGVASAVRGPSGDVVGALTIAAVESRLPKERQAVLGKQLVKEALWLEAHLRKAGKVRKSVRG